MSLESELMEKNEDIEKDKDMENTDVKDLAEDLVAKIRDARLKGKKKPSDNKPEAETVKE